MNGKTILIILLTLLVVAVSGYFILPDQKNAPGQDIGKTDMNDNTGSGEALQINSSRYPVSAGLPKGMEVSTGLQNVTFCGQTYKSKEVVVDGRNVIQRLSELLHEDPEKNEWYCDTLLGRALNEGGVLESGEELRIVINIDEMYPTEGVPQFPERPRHYEFAVSLSRTPESLIPVVVEPEQNTITIGGVAIGALQ